MNIFDRLGYAFISGFFGALIGLAGWWLYGEAYSLNYSGPAMDPVLRHWLIGCIAVFAVLGFVFKEQAADFVGDTINVFFHFELNSAPGYIARYVLFLVLVVICIAAIWYTTP